MPSDEQRTAACVCKDGSTSMVSLKKLKEGSTNNCRARNKEPTRSQTDICLVGSVCTMESCQTLKQVLPEVSQIQGFDYQKPFTKRLQLMLALLHLRTLLASLAMLCNFVKWQTFGFPLHHIANAFVLVHHSECNHTLKYCIINWDYAYPESPHHLSLIFSRLGQLLCCHENQRRNQNVADCHMF